MNKNLVEIDNYFFNGCLSFVKTTVLKIKYNNNKCAFMYHLMILITFLS